jgi:hypothetical protein
MTRPPAHVSAVFERLAGGPVPVAEWRPVLEFADRTQLTLHLRSAAGMPEWVRAEIDSRFARNARRRARLGEAYEELADALSRDGVKFAVLKGFTHETGFGLEPGTRVQYDLDLLSPRPETAHRVLLDLGYRPHGVASLSAEHDRPWVRPSAWAWRGDYFDPEMPIAVEVHSTPWNPRRDRIAVRGVEEFWNRRDARNFRLCEPDRIAFAALHVLRHVLRNDARPAHTYELARFLAARYSDQAFWAAWQATQTAEVRELAAIAFGFAHQWFACPVPECAVLPPSVSAWFRQFAWSPVVNLTTPNKDVVWLHLALVKGTRSRLAVMQSRLAPLRIPDGSEAPGSNALWKRLCYHTAGSTRAVARGALWGLRRAASSTAAQTSDWKRSSV